jgi:tRNA-dihydrouridine synthase C
MIENAQAIEQAGAAQLVVHARTKESGYRPPADWEALALIREAIHIPLMANGEIWTREDALLCQKISGCKSLMLGRGAVSHPQLVNQIRAENIEAITWQDLRQWQIKFLDKMKEASLPSHEIRFGAVWTERGAIGRYKQWLGMLTRCWPEAVILFSQIKKLQTWDEVMAIVMQE